MKEPSAFFMIRMLFQPRDLFQLIRRPIFSRFTVDTGYLIHCALKELFAERAPTPFEIMGTGEGVTEVLAYSDFSHIELLDSIRPDAPESLKNAAYNGDFSSRRMPGQFSRGQLYSYRIRLCPVIRKARGSGERAGSEVDVFLAEAERSGVKKGLDRSDVYLKWFKTAINKKECLDIQSVRISELKLDKLLRRNSERQGQSIVRPNAVFQGIWKVTEPDSFRVLLRNGFGRHKAFGFGMILLKPLGE